jgi:hypothetical protein
MQSDCWIEQIAAERAQPRKRPLLIGAGELAVPDYIRCKNGCELPGLCHGRSLYRGRVARLIARAALRIREPGRTSFAVVREKL